MHQVYIDLCQFQIDLHGLKSGMPEHGLQGIGIAAVAQVLDGEGVAEAVRVNIEHPCPSADVGEHICQLAPVDDAIQLGYEERIIVPIVFSGGRHVSRRSHWRECFSLSLDKSADMRIL